MTGFGGMKMSERALKIGEVSKLTGLAPETIRYYERQGVLSPVKSKESGYRSYSKLDVYFIVRIRAYMQMGFSMSQAQELIESPSMDQMQRALLNRADAIQKEIADQMKLLQTIYNRIQSIQFGRESIGRVLIREMPEFLGLSRYDAGGEIDLSLPHDAWYNRQDVAYPYCVFGLDERDQVYIDRMGMCATASEIEHSELKGTSNDRLESCPCVYTSAIVSDRDTMEKTQQIANDLLKRYPSTFKRTIIHRTIAAMNDRPEGTYFLEFWMPLTEYPVER